VNNCVFCMIVSGEIPSAKIYEDEDILAFDDIAPQAPVHALVVPKRHFFNLSDDVPASVVCRLFESVVEVARLKGVEKTGYRIIVNNGSDANQTVAHLHAHVMGGRRMSHGMVTFDK